MEQLAFGQPLPGFRKIKGRHTVFYGEGWQVFHSLLKELRVYERFATPHRGYMAAYHHMEAGGWIADFLDKLPPLADTIPVDMAGPTPLTCPDQGPGLAPADIVRADLVERNLAWLRTLGYTV